MPKKAEAKTKTYEITLRVTLRELSAKEACLTGDEAAELLAGEVDDEGAKAFADTLADHIPDNEEMMEGSDCFVVAVACDVVGYRLTDATRAEA